MVRLSNIERKVLGGAHLYGADPATSIARRSGVKVKSVRRAISRLRERDVIHGVRPFIDPFRLGLSLYSHFILLDEPSHKRDIASILKADRNVGWINEYVGPYDLSFILYARNTTDHEARFAELLSKMPCAFAKRVTTVRTGFYGYGMRYLSPRNSTLLPNERFIYEASSSSGSEREPDPLEILLLQHLCTSATRSVQTLAREHKVPVSTLHDRCIRLEREGIVKGYTVAVNPLAIGMSRFKILFDADLSHRAREDLFSFFSENEWVVSAALGIGKWSIEVNVEVDDPHMLKKTIEGIRTILGRSLREYSLLTLLSTPRATQFHSHQSERA